MPFPQVPLALGDLEVVHSVRVGTNSAVDTLEVSNRREDRPLLLLLGLALVVEARGDAFPRSSGRALHSQVQAKASR